MAERLDPHGRPIISPASFARGERALRRRDPALARWMDRVGRLTELRQQRHHFGSLARAIISQQLAAAAAKTIHARFVELFRERTCRRRPDPETLLAIDDETLRSVGLSRQKLAYLRALAEAFTGELGRARFARLPDEAVVEKLVAIPGIGVWTAEMFLIFALGRIDVYSPGDLALRNGLARVEEIESPPPKQAAEIAERWSPWRSVASLYLWRIAHLDEESA